MTATHFKTREDMLNALTPLTQPDGVHDTLHKETENVVQYILDISKNIPFPASVIDRLIGHIGLRGELWNGTGMVFHYYLKKPCQNPLSSPDEAITLRGIEEYSRAFLEKPSQLSNAPLLHLHPDEAKETSGSALERCHREIVSWAQKIGPETRATDISAIKKIEGNLEKLFISLERFNATRIILEDFAHASHEYMNSIKTEHQAKPAFNRPHFNIS